MAEKIKGIGARLRFCGGVCEEKRTILHKNSRLYDGARLKKARWTMGACCAVAAYLYAVQEALRQAYALNGYVRHWDLKGHTSQEVQGDGDKIVSIFGETVRREEKKIYPNDPCPCGSRKKYKHCCGRK